MSSGHRVISCIVPHGRGHEILVRLFHEQGVTRATVQAARGFSGSRTPGMFDRVEKDVLTVVASDAQSEELFGWLYEAIDVGGTPGCFMYQARLSTATPFALPDDVPLETP